MGSHQESSWFLWILRPTVNLILANWTPFLTPYRCPLSPPLGWCLNTSYTMLALSPIVCWLRCLSWYYHPWSVAHSILNLIQTKTFLDIHFLLPWILLTRWCSPLLLSWSFITLSYSIPAFHTKHPLGRSQSWQRNHLRNEYGVRSPGFWVILG